MHDVARTWCSDTLVSLKLGEGHHKVKVQSLTEVIIMKSSKAPLTEAVRKSQRLNGLSQLNMHHVSHGTQKLYTCART